MIDTPPEGRKHINTFFFVEGLEKNNKRDYYEGDSKRGTGILYF